MNLNYVGILLCVSLLLMIGGGCQTSHSSRLHEIIDLDKVTKAVVVHRSRDKQTMVIDTVILPPPLLQRFVRAWNTSEEDELMKFLPSFTIIIQFNDRTSRSFRLNGHYVKEKNDWSFLLSDTTILASLDSLP